MRHGACKYGVACWYSHGCDNPATNGTPLTKSLPDIPALPVDAYAQGSFAIDFVHPLATVEEATLHCAAADFVAPMKVMALLLAWLPMSLTSFTSASVSSGASSPSSAFFLPNFATKDFCLAYHATQRVAYPHLPSSLVSWTKPLQTIFLRNSIGNS